MQIHENFDSLKSKMSANEKSTITSEPVLEDWQRDEVYIIRCREDEHGVLKISVGGIGPFNYLVFQGDHSKCVDLLRKALIALQKGPK